MDLIENINEKTGMGRTLRMNEEWQQRKFQIDNLKEEA